MREPTESERLASLISYLADRWEECPRTFGQQGCNQECLKEATPKAKRHHIFGCWYGLAGEVWKDHERRKHGAI